MVDLLIQTRIVIFVYVKCSFSLVSSFVQQKPSKLAEIA
jgi:hypothetical protein